jgi:hypothetical protein
MIARRTIIVLACTIILCLMQTVNVYGQPGDPDPPDGVPITGIEYLLGGGLLYGIRSLIKARKKQSD